MKKQLFIFTLITLFAAVVFAQEQDKTVQSEKTDAAKTKTEKIKLPSARDVFKSHVKATGGREAAEKVKSRTMKGTVELPAMGLKGTFEMLSKSPNKSIATMNLSGFGEIIEAFDGSEAWAKNPLQGLRVKTGKELDEVKESSDFNYDINFEKIYPNAAVTGIEKTDGAEVYVVKADEDATFYFDRQTGLLTRVDRTITSPEGKINSVTKFEDYRVVDGVKQSFKFRQSALGAEFVFNIAEIKQNVEIPDEKFSKPK